MGKKDLRRFFASFALTTITLLLIMGIALADSRIKATTGREDDETALAFSVSNRNELQITVFNDRYGMDVAPLGGALNVYKSAAKAAGRLAVPALAAAQEVYAAVDAAAYPVFSGLAGLLGEQN